MATERQRAAIFSCCVLLRWHVSLSYALPALRVRCPVQAAAIFPDRLASLYNEYAVKTFLMLDW